MQQSLPHTLTAEIEKISENDVTLKFQNNQTLSWPKNLISEKIKKGDKIELIALTKEEINSEHRDLAKSVLKEMLSGK